MKIRSERSSDYNTIDRVLYAAFKNEDEAQLVRALRKIPAFIPQLSLVADVGDVVGCALFSRIRIQTSNTSIETLSLAPVGVLPGFQKKGIGAALIKEGIERGQKLGFKSVVVVGPASFYAKFGFKPAKPMGLMLPFPAPDDSFLALELEPDALKGIQGAVIYPAAFLHVL